MLKLNLSFVFVGVFSMVAIITPTRTANAWQCPSATPGCSSACSGATCTVTTQCELENALRCLCLGTGCSHIVIASTTTLIVTSPITIGSGHNNLELEIAGTVKYVLPGTPPATPPSGEKMFHLKGCNTVRIHGGTNNTGVITTGYLPSVTEIPKAFLIEDGSSNITIENLEITSTGQGITIDSTTHNPAASNVTFRNLRIHHIRNFGIFMNKEVTAVIDDCDIWTTSGSAHGIRFNAENVSVKNCFAYDIGSSGLWAQAGGNVSIDGFSTNRWIAIGPNATSDGNTNEFFEDAFAQRIAMQEQDALNGTFFVHMGTTGACLVNMCGPMFHVGAPAFYPKPIDYIHWDSIDGLNCTDESAECGPANSPVCVYCSSYLGTHVGQVSYDYCFADITRDDVVGIDDLLAVITGWGECDEPPGGLSGPHQPCAADVYPNICGDNVVNIDDLLLVISNWGECPTNPPCGSSTGRTGGSGGDAPQSIEDCYDQCIAQYPEGGEAFIAAYDACIESLCRAQIIECD